MQSKVDENRPKRAESALTPAQTRWELTSSQATGAFWLAFGLAGLLLLYFLTTVPGLHGDEAWPGVRSWEIWHGKRPMIGMTWYTGPMQQYMLAPLLAVFGRKVLILRLFTVGTSLITLCLYYAVIKRMFNRTVAAFAALTLVSLPSFTAYGRLAYEVFALNPVLMVGAIFLLLKADECAPPRREILWLLSGISMGLGTWNHLIFLSVPMSLLIAALFHYRMRLFRGWRLYVTLYGFFLGIAPRLIFALASSDHTIAAVGGIDGPKFINELLVRLKEWPWLLVQMIHGKAIYQRFSGGVRVDVPILIALILLVGIGLSIAKTRGSSSPSSIPLLVFSVALFLSTVVLCQKDSDRYFLLVLYTIPVFVALTFKRILQCRAFSRLGPVLFALFLGLQLAGIAFNYFVPQIESGGQLSLYWFGSELETSNNYTRTDGLYDKLVSLGAKHIYAEFFITMPLRFYDLDLHNFASAAIIDSPRAVPSADECAPLC
jgi:uncharacterized membrane protein